MAGDIIIRFTGDASGLASFYSGVARQTDDFVNRITKTYRGQFQNILGTQLFPTSFKTIDGKIVNSTAGTAVKGLRFEFDRLNDVIKVTGTSGLKLSQGGFLPVAETNAFRGSVSALTDVLLRQEAVLAQEAKSVAAYDRAVNALGKNRAAALAIAQPFSDTKDSAAANLAALRAQRTALTDLLKQRRDFQNSLAKPLTGAAKTSFDDYTNRLLTQRADLQKLVARATRDLTKAQLAYDQALADPRIANYDARIAKLGSALEAKKAQYAASIGALQAQEQAVLTSAPTVVPKGFQQLPPQLRSILQQGGLANTAEGLYAQEAKFNAPVKDLVRGVTDLSGSFKDNQGVVTRWAAELDKNGKLVTRFGGNLSGISRIGQQIVRDFQKVIEWTVATTVVFGGLATAISGLGLIKQLDIDLKRFGITANLTATETSKFFGQISEVAQSTATPLEDMVKAADDIALAVQKPGESTEHLTHDVLALAEAVGIYTNLTGSDTVSATNQLVAIMKQLGLEAGSVVGVLNKITAVAGGQSQAISDITEGLSVMAEAGKQANLTIDQQIATIQVLSQVTSKSPAEIATAFKNLVGAIQNPAGVKALEKYNIALHDQQGNLRNLIDIYAEIQQKIQSGIIPQGEVSKLIRDISGGPRRAPDAAALLANIGQVQKTTATSVNATNEALLANAQILDTLQSKFVQFQNAIKSAAFQQLIGAFRELAAAGIQLGTTLLNLISKIPPGLITLGGKLLFVALAFTTLVKVARGIGGVFGAIGISLRGLAQQQTIAASSAATLGEIYDASSKKIVAGAAAQEAALTRLGRVRAGLGKYGGAITTAIIGAGIGAATSGGNISSIAGAGLQGLGAGLLALPEPTGLTKLAGIVALLGGTLLPNLVGADHDATEAERQHAQAVLQVYDAYRSAATVLIDANTTQKNLTDEYDRLNAITKKTPEDIQRINDIQKELADNFKTTITATSDLNKALGDLAGVDPGLATLAQQAQLSTLSIAELDKAVQKYQKTVLQNQFPDLQTPSEQNLPTFKPVNNYNVGTGTLATGSIQTVTGGKTLAPGSAQIQQITVDLSKLGEEGNNVADIFDSTGKTIRLAFDPTTLNIAAIQSALANATNLTDEFKANALAAIQQFGTQNNELIQAARLVEFYNAALDNIRPFISQQDYDRAQKYIKLLQTIIQAFGAGKLTKSQFDQLFSQASSDYRAAQSNVGLPEEEKQKIFNANIKEDLTILAQNSGILNGLKEGTQEWTNKMNEFGIVAAGVENVIQAVGGAVNDVDEGIATLSDNLQQLKADTLANLSDKSLQAFNDLKNGTINSAQYEKTKAAIDAQRVAVITLSDALDEAANKGGESFVQALKDISGGLETIPGLENATSLSGDQLIAQLLKIADTMGLTKDQTDKLKTAVLGLIKTAALIDQIKAQLSITANVGGLKELKTLLNTMKVVLIAGAAATSVLGGSPGSGYQSALSLINASLAQISSFESATGGANYEQQLQNLISGASGTGGSSGSKKKKTTAGSGPNVSTLDLPTEIANSVNRNALIQEAIKRARALQSTIPGATKDAKNDIVELLKGTQNILEVRGIKDDFLRKALEELADIEKKRLDFETKADTIRRIRVGAGSFAAIANVPVNSTTGVSLGGPEGPINITLNINGTVLTPAQLAQFADLVGAAIKRQIANG